MATATNTTNPPAARDTLAIRFLRLQAEHNLTWAERQTITMRHVSKGRTMFDAERKAMKVTDPKFNRITKAVSEEIARAEPRTYADLRTKLECVLDPHLGWDMEPDARTAVEQVLAFLITHEPDSGTRHLERIAADLAKAIDRYNAKAHQMETEKGKRRFQEICDLTDEIIDYPATNAADAAIKAQLLRDQLRVYSSGEKQERLLADIITFLEHTGDVAEREVGALA